MKEHQRTLGVLLVEDDPGDARLVREALFKVPGKGFRLYHVQRLRDGLAAVEDREFDVVLLDLGLPDADGLTALQRMREATIELPVVILAGLADEALAEGAIRSGADDCLSKSELQPGHLARSLRRAIDRRARERELRRLSSILEATPDLVATVDARGTVLYLNPSGCQIVGLDPEQVVGSAVTSFLPAWADEMLRSVAVPAAMREGVWSGEIAVLDPDVLDPDEDEIPLWIELISHPNARGEIEYLSVIGRDLRGRRAIEERLRRGERLETVGRLAGGVAHDFNNLLTTILASAVMMGQDVPDDSPLRVDIEEIVAAVERAKKLTGQLLAFSRRGSVQATTIALGPKIRDMEPMLRRVLGEDVQLRVDVEASGMGIEIDPGQLEMLILNLATNAREAMPKGGTVQIQVASVDLEAGSPDLPPDATPGSYARLSVEDTGEGMSRDVLDHIFEPFFTTKEAGRGTGLGLSSVYGIVQRSGGGITVQSEPHEGTGFFILFPSVEVQETPAPASITAAKAAERGQTILLVEDDHSVRYVAARSLRRGGFRVIEAPTAEEALRTMESEPTVDLLITDIVMPGMNGQELVESLRSKHPGLATLYISGYTPEEIGRRAFIEGERLLRKPFAPEELIREAEQALQARGAGRGGTA